MDKNILIKKIQGVGLTRHEALVYLACLESGNSPASQIAASGGMNRVTVYDTLKKLLHKGMVSSSTMRGIKHFSAIPPEVFVEDSKSKAKELAESLPLLQELNKEEESKPSVRHFEGIEGIKKAYKETLKAQSEILNYANSQNIRNHWDNYDTEYVEQRVKKEIFLRGFAPNDKLGKEVQKKDKDFLRITKLLDKKHFEVENEIKVFDNKVLIASFEPKAFAVIIESSAAAETQRQIFGVLWSLSND